MTKKRKSVAECFLLKKLKIEGAQESVEEIYRNSKNTSGKLLEVKEIPLRIIKVLCRCIGSRSAVESNDRLAITRYKKKVDNWLDSVAQSGQIEEKVIVALRSSSLISDDFEKLGISSMLNLTSFVVRRSWDDAQGKFLVIQATSQEPYLTTKHFLYSLLHFVDSGEAFRGSNASVPTDLSADDIGKREFVNQLS